MNQVGERQRRVGRGHAPRHAAADDWKCIPQPVEHELANRVADRLSAATEQAGRRGPSHGAVNRGQAEGKRVGESLDREPGVQGELQGHDDVLGMEMWLHDTSMLSSFWKVEAIRFCRGHRVLVVGGCSLSAPRGAVAEARSPKPAVSQGRGENYGAGRGRTPRLAIPWKGGCANDRKNSTTPGWTRTSDPGIRNPMLYPAELRARRGFWICVSSLAQHTSAVQSSWPGSASSPSRSCADQVPGRYSAGRAADRL